MMTPCWFTATTASGIASRMPDDRRVSATVFGPDSRLWLGTSGWLILHTTGTIWILYVKRRELAEKEAEFTNSKRQRKETFISAFGMCWKPRVITTAISICIPLKPTCTRKLAATERVTARTTPHTTPTRKITGAAPHAQPYCGR